LLVVCCLFGSTARKMPYTPQAHDAHPVNVLSREATHHRRAAARQVMADTARLRLTQGGYAHATSNNMGRVNRCDHLKSRAGIHKKLAELSYLAIIIAQTDTDRGGRVVTVPDYVAIGVLIVLIVWAVADWVPRGKL